MVEHRGDYDRTDWAPAQDARRFECGSPNFLGIHALEASLSLLEEVGPDRVAADLGERVDHLVGLIDARGLELLSTREPERRAGIVTFRAAGVDSAWLHRALMARRVLCAQRGGGIRFSPHFSTPVAVIDRAMDTVAALVASKRRG
jgi:selenocysteine lyase/cysteine desulfurase